MLRIHFASRISPLSFRYYSHVFMYIYIRNFVTLFRDNKISDGIFASDRFRAIHISAVENSAPLKIDTITGVLQQRGMFKRLPRLNVSTFSLGENYFDKILEKYLVEG